MPLLSLSPDELLSTTRAVRKRLDFDRPVEDELIRECVELALQSPSGSNNPTMQFVVVRDAERRRALGDIYRQCYDIYRSMDGIYIRTIAKGDADADAQQQRSADSADFLGEHMGEAPVLVIPCTVGARLDGVPAMMSASIAANVMPAMWSFMLAARARGLGTCCSIIRWTEVQQVCMSPVAYTKGTDFKPVKRPPADAVIHWDGW
jgi:nitroreductase